ncbi:MAG: hypothetical protein IT389_14180 [Nitrospira sp.]|nr:hypothetical protein [Nitrospira sp.]
MTKSTDALNQSTRFTYDPANGRSVTLNSVSTKPGAAQL